MGERVVLCTISPTEHYINRSYASFVVPSCPKGAPFLVFDIESSRDYKRLVEPVSGQVDLVPVDIPAETIAKDIIKTEDLEREGVFICAGEQPTEQEVATARAKRKAWLVECVRQGDEVFGARGPAGLSEIPTYCKRAAEELGEKRQWVFTGAEEKTQCPVCGEMLPLLLNGQAPAICKSCGAVLDKQRAEAFGLIAAEKKQEPQTELEPTGVKAKK